MRVKIMFLVLAALFVAWQPWLAAALVFAAMAAVSAVLVVYQTAAILEEWRRGRP